MNAPAGQRPSRHARRLGEAERDGSTKLIG
jgi:hypothetical protein